MNKKFKLHKENPTELIETNKPTMREIEDFFKGKEITDLQKYTYSFVIKKKEK